MKLFELYDIAEQSNIEINAFDLGANISLAVQLENGKESIAINPMLLSTAAEETTCLAHELGHCMTGSFYNRYSKLDIIGKHEEMATRWSIRQLIPKDKLYQAFEKYILTIWELAEYFDVPEDFIVKSIEYYKLVV